MSFELLAPLIEPAVRDVSEVEAVPDAEPALDGDPAPDAEPVPEAELEPAPEAEPLPPPIFAFFNTKPPPGAPALAEVPLLAVLLPRCRQPVAVTWPAWSVDECPLVDG